MDNKKTSEAKVARTSGILLHPTSLPSSFAIGDFGASSFEFIDRLKDSNQSLWQMLPLCPVDGTNSPYQSPSAFAGEPLLIDVVKLQELGLLTEDELNNSKVDFQGKTNFDLAREKKYPLFKIAYERINNSDNTFKKAFEKFKKSESYWLDGYSLFMAVKEDLIKLRSEKTPEVEKELAQFIKDNYKEKVKPTTDGKNETNKSENLGSLSKNQLTDYYKSAVWNTFPKDLKNLTETTVKEYKSKLKDRINYFSFLQYLFFSQWSEVKSYANKNGIKIVGDIPFFVSYDSADVWQNQKDFTLDKKGFPTSVAGVPPDYFSKTGQLWGNPLYNFKNQKKNNYEWWYLRFKKSLEMSDIIRVDHFRAFESYWKIPFGSKNAINGVWEKSVGIKFFQTMQERLGKDNLPIIAEDLGIITDEVTALRKATGYDGMSILHFAFGENKENAYLPHMINKDVVLYTGTHDNNTTRGWYKNATEVEKDHFRRYMNSSGENASWDLIRLAFASVANCVIIPLQDVLDLDENYAMNTPGTVGGNWSFAFNWHMWEHEKTEALAYLSELFARNTNTGKTKKK